MIVKRRHYFWILGVYLLGLVGGGVAGFFLSMSDEIGSGMGMLGMMVYGGALLGSCLLSLLVVATLASKQRVVAHYIGLLLLAQVGAGVLITGLMGSVFPLIGSTWAGRIFLLVHVGWVISPAIAYFFATRLYRLTPSIA